MEGLRGAPRFLSFPKPVQVEEGGDAILQCRLAGSPPPTVTWEKDGRPLEASERLRPRAAGAQCGLLLRGAGPGDAGLYVCRARNPTGEAYAAATLSVKDSGVKGPGPSQSPSLTAPGPSQSPSLTAPGPSQSPSLTASAPSQDASFPTSGLPWAPSLTAPGPSHDPLLPAPCLPQDPSLRAPSPSQDPSLMTPKPCQGPSDTSGLDRVEALPRPLPLTQRPSAQPLDTPPPPALSPPIFLQTPRSQSVMRGAEVLLSCQVQGRPGVQLQWEKDGQPLGHVWESGHFTLTPQPDGSHSLKIRGARIPDAGVYVCRARDTGGEALAAALLQVETPEEEEEEASLLPLPRRGRKSGGAQTGGRQEPKSFWVSEGKHAKFRCYVTGKPAPEAVWHRDGRALAPGRRHLLYRARDGAFILKVLYCQPDDRGLYVCSARNDAGSTLSAVQLNIKEPRVRFAVPLEDVEGDELGSAVLECEVPAPGEPTAWFREERRLQPSAKYELGEAGPVRRLAIHDLQPDDDGVYLCEMRGRVRTVAVLTVRGPILQRLPRKLEALEGENVVLSVKTREAEAGGLWSRDGQQLPASPRVLQTRFGRTHSLVLVGVTGRDAGTVTFSLGASHTSAQLRVTLPTVRVNRGLEDVLVAPGQDATFSLTLSASVSGAWFVDGAKVETDGVDAPRGARAQDRGSQPSLTLRAVRPRDDGTRVEFVCPGVRQSATLHLQEPPVRVVRPLDEVRVEARSSERVVLTCELNRPGVSVRWYHDGLEVEESESLQLESQGPRHRLLLPAVRPKDAGDFVCDAGDNSATFSVVISEPPMRVVRPLDEVRVEARSSERVVLTCELNRPGVSVRWYHDGLEVEESESLQLESQGPRHRLLLPAVRPRDAGEFVCDAGDDSAFFSVVVSEPPVRVVQPLEEVRVEARSSERVVLTCELNRPGVSVRWYHDGLEVEESESLQLESQGPRHRLLLPAARPRDAGDFVCNAGDDSAFFSVVISEPPVRVVEPRDEVTVEAQSSEQVRGLEVEDSGTLQLESQGPCHRPLLPAAQPQDARDFVCDTEDDSATFSVVISEAPVTLAGGHRDLQGTEGDPATFNGDSSRAQAEVTLDKDWDSSPSAAVGADSSAVVDVGGRRAQITIQDDVGRPAVWGLRPVWAREGDTATFQCSVTGNRIGNRNGIGNGKEAEEEEEGQEDEEDEAHRAQPCWRQQGRLLRPGPTVRMRREGNRHFLILSELCVEDAGEISFQAGDAVSVTQLEVEASPVLLVRRPPREKTVLAGRRAGRDIARTVLLVEGGS
ncbi:obscurin-like protein 1 [Tachyglossus aculeatus]|uniref:obscurin-like protein 1 n=1 Tax=Tachyglossus aculeatus TaxID=9261 RepID=UPI0018F790FC|nr:obscurin-like protein 1 [Tachyglossus aculeatus]